MKVNSPVTKVLQPLQPVQNSFKLRDSYTELVFIGAGGDMLDGVCFHVGVDAECHRGLFPQPACNSVDDIEFRCGFCIETLDVQPQSLLYLSVALANPCKHSLAGRKSACNGMLHLVAADTVSSESVPCDDLHNHRIEV